MTGIYLSQFFLTVKFEFELKIENRIFIFCRQSFLQP